ncbi:MAG TPA: adenylate/guanylate cyclase domain-containing protein, partial [Urbifossiella sp.]|nr:adenylate/guanylate cyclase domain-containing protein [Urbifossiella sp.]
MLRFRYTLITLLGGVILLTVTVIGVSGYLNSRAAAAELSEQILQQNALRIDQEVEKLLEQATDQCALNLRLLKAGRLDGRDRPALVGYWREVLAVQPELTSLFLADEATGEAVGVSRLRTDRLSVWQTDRDPAGRLVLREFWAADYPRAPFKAGGAGPDVRSRPWYAAARRAGRPVWTDAYVFLGVEGVHDVLGVTYAAPDYHPDGTLRAVLTADFDLETLSRFLAGLRVGREGEAFLVEQGADGTPRVIAHPRSDLLTRPAAGGGRELVPTGELADGPARAFLAAAGPPDEPDRSVRFDHDGRTFVGTAHRVAGADRPPWRICALVPEDEILAHANRTIRLTGFVTVAVFAVATLLGVFLSRQVARPLEQLAAEALAAGRLRLESGPAVRSIVLEVDQLARATDAMKAGLRSFGKYIPVELVRGLLDSGREARLGGERREVTIAFTDIAGFSATAESLPSEALVAHLGEYLAAVSQAVQDSGGTVDKFIGDGVMAFWGAPAASRDHAAAVCVAACRCQQRLRGLRPGWAAAGRPP